MEREAAELYPVSKSLIQSAYTKRLTRLPVFPILLSWFLLTFWDAIGVLCDTMSPLNRHYTLCLPLRPVTEEERKIIQLQEALRRRLRRSKYYIVETTRSDGIYLRLCFLFLHSCDDLRRITRTRTSIVHSPALNLFSAQRPESRFSQRDIRGLFHPKRKKRGTYWDYRAFCPGFSIDRKFYNRINGQRKEIES